MGMSSWIKLYQTVSVANLVKQALRGESTSNFLYCTGTVQREGFNMLFWTVPLDNWSWALLGISVLLITAIIRGQWFPVFAILMRQDCTILNGRHTVLLMIFILATIIFSYGYEGVVSSLLTAQPPLIVFTTLKEVLNGGYKLFAPNGGELTPYKRIFEREYNGYSCVQNVTLKMGIK